MHIWTTNKNIRYKIDAKTGDLYYGHALETLTTMTNLIIL